MKKYSSNNSKEVLLPLLVIVIMILPLKIIYDECNLFIFVLSILFSLTFLIYIIKKTRESIFEIVFYDNQIEIIYSYIKKVEKLKYSDLLEYHFIRTSKSNTDHIIYISGKKSFSSLEYKNTIEFIKWLKEKNPNIKINIFPSDSTLEYEFQKETGFKYREFHKDTL